MHDTAYQAGVLAMDIYADLSTASVLEITDGTGAGSFRDRALPTTRFLRVSDREGAGVDLVAEQGKALPVDDAEFDLVISNFALHRDPAFWTTMLEMARAAREGGFIFLTALAEGSAVDGAPSTWCFDHQAGIAIEKWCRSQGQLISLVESFIADRDTGEGSDFIAVFRKGRIVRDLPQVFVHQHLISHNVRTWRSQTLQSARPGGVISARLDDANQKVADALHQNAQLTAHIHALEQELAATRANLAEAEKERDLAAARQAQAESLQHHWENLYRRQQRQATTQAQADSKREKKGPGEADELAERIKQQKARIDGLTRALETSEKRLKEYERLRSNHFAETSTLSRQLLERDQHLQQLNAKLERARRLHDVLMSRPAWWFLLPKTRQAALEKARLKAMGLFDAKSYLQNNPDVVEAGYDPLRHYALHGVYEDRNF